MLNYSYTRINTITRKSKRFVIYDVNSSTDVMTDIIHDVLKCKQQSRYNKLFANYHGSMKDIDAIRDYLPTQYKQYADNPIRLTEHMASLYEISRKYMISNVVIDVKNDMITDVKNKGEIKCFGCVYDCPGQRDHMQCPTGCLHDPITCGCQN